MLSQSLPIRDVRCEFCKGTLFSKSSKFVDSILHVKGTLSFRNSHKKSGVLKYAMWDGL